jgi:hypothetical protein
MAINFPSSPTEGQKFTSGLVVYTFSNGVWNAAPLDTALPFNYLVNPAMQISQQKGTTILLTPAGLYPADQWMIQTTLTDQVTARSVSSSTPNGSPNIIRLQVSTAATGGTDSRYFGVVQYIEGQRIAANKFGTAGAVPMVLRFWAKHPSSAGNWGGGIRNGDSTRGFAYDYAIQPSQVNQWAEIVISIPGDTTGTWAKDNTSGLHVWWTITNNYSNLQAISGSWVNGNIIAPMFLYNGTGIVNALFELGDVGLYLDPLNTGRAPPWQPPDFGQARMDALRYWNKVTSLRGVSAGASNARAGNGFTCDMRAGPALAIVGTITAWDQAASSTVTSLAGAYQNTHYVETECNTAAAMTTGRACFLPPGSIPDAGPHIVANARM